MDDLCRNGLEALEELLARQSPPEKDLIAEATRCVARYRDELIAKRRQAHEPPQERLGEVNALLSELVAAEFPLVGVRRKRIEAARDAYRKMRDFLMSTQKLSEDEAISLMSVAVDFAVTQVVDGNWGVHAALKKRVFTG